MIVFTKDGRKAELMKFKQVYTDPLLGYLVNLSVESKSRFGPHPFTLDGINEVLGSSQEVLGYIATEAGTDRIIAYSLIKTGYLDTDGNRYSGYGLHLTHSDVCTYAPSVADQWQGSGLGSSMFEFILNDIRQSGFRTMILWGGVQASNSRALAFYQQRGFMVAGEFEHKGMNLDMYLPMPDR